MIPFQYKTYIDIDGKIECTTWQRFAAWVLLETWIEINEGPHVAFSQ